MVDDDNFCLKYVSRVWRAMISNVGGGRDYKMAKKPLRRNSNIDLTENGRTECCRAGWPDWFFFETKFEDLFFNIYNGFGVFLLTLFSKFDFLGVLFFVKIWSFLYQKMEMSSSKMKILANGSPESEKIWPPCCRDIRQSPNRAGQSGYAVLQLKNQLNSILDIISHRALHIYRYPAIFIINQFYMGIYQDSI